MISAASHQRIFFAIAFNNTSCNFIIRSVSAAPYCCGVSTLQLYPAALKADRSHTSDTLLPDSLRSAFCCAMIHFRVQALIDAR